jgi:hypothetical protein
MTNEDIDKVKFRLDEERLALEKARLQQQAISWAFRLGLSVKRSQARLFITPEYKGFTAPAVNGRAQSTKP